MAKDKEKKEIVSKTEVPGSEILDKDTEVSESPQNKTDEISEAEMISDSVSIIDDSNLRNSGMEKPSEFPNQPNTEQEEVPTKENKKQLDIQNSKTDEQQTHRRADAETVATGETHEKQKSSIVSMLMGGIISSALGFSAAYYLFTSDILTHGVTISDVQAELSTNIKSNADGISQNAKTSGDQESQLQNIIAKLKKHDVQFESLTSSLASITNLTKRVDDLESRIENIKMLAEDLNQLVAKLEKRPVATTLSSELIDAYNFEVAKLLETMATQRKEVETLLDEANAEKAQASEVARKTQANLTLNALQMAFNAGNSFATELDEFSKLSDFQIPANLQKIASEGVPRLETLTDNFPEAARAAISAERSRVMYDGTIKSLLGFLKLQFQARSVTPKEGTDADAVLSRVEGALRDGRLDKAVEELQALQSPAKEVMADWQARAQQRLNLVEVLNSLSGVVEN